MLNLYIKESYVLNETIEDIRRYYPNIPDDIFMRLIKLDPTYRGNDSVGKYGKWLLNLYNRGNLSEEEFNEIPELLNQFTIYRNRIANKDLNSYKSLNDLMDVLANVINDDSMLTDRQRLRFLKNVKSGKIATDKKNDYDVVLNTPNFIVYKLNTHEAAMNLGNGTEWCTAHENPMWYLKYTENGGSLYIVKDKKTGERWQYSDVTNDFYSEDDKPINGRNPLAEDNKLSAFFAKFLQYDVSKPYIYTGEEIPEKLYNLITNIHIDDGVNEIEDSAFYKMTQLQNVIIPNSVKIIGEDAFKNTGLTNIIIPNSVTDIENNAFSRCKYLNTVKLPNSIESISSWLFSGCTSLTTINIPNSVKYIEKRAFYDNISLKTLNIPNSVEYINDSAFGACINLTIHTNNEYVINYCRKNNIPVKPLTKNEAYRRYKS